MRTISASQIEAYGLTVTDAARMLGITRPALSSLLNERASLSFEMALRIEKAFDMSMDTLISMQSSFDIARTRQDCEDIDIQPFAKKQTTYFLISSYIFNTYHDKSRI